MEHWLWTVIHYAWICLYFASAITADTPFPKCVEETLGKDVSFEPIKVGKVKDERQCILSCMKQPAPKECKACVFHSGICKLYNQSAKASPEAFVDHKDGAIYYELLEKCPTDKEKMETKGGNNDIRFKLAVDKKETEKQAADAPQPSPVGGNSNYAMPPPSALYSPSPTPVYSGEPPSATPDANFVPPRATRATYLGPGEGLYVSPTYPGYTRPPPLSQWSEWTPWTSCVCVYGSGTKSRTRTCQSPNPTCTGSSDDSQPCDCPKAEWSDWTQWSPCTASCGGGTQKRTRQCSIPDECAGACSEQQPCGNKPCQEWGPWQPWGSCSVTCGSGVQLRNRPCVGGEKYGGGGCIGPSSEQQACEKPPCCTEWGPWEQCSVTCSTGIQTRKRDCGPATGGENSYTPGPPGTRETSPETKQQRPCDQGECPTWSSWQPGPCSVTCGEGTITRTRQCQGGGCQGPSTDTTPCNAGPCPTWSPWNPWQPCSATCGTGTRTRTRSCEGGHTCKGESTQSEPCDSGPCPQWTSWRTGPCSVTCGEGEQPMDRECQNGADCPGESHRALKCNPGPCLEWCPWSSWGPCTVTCGPGTRKRQRQCAIPGSCPEHHACPSCGTPYAPGGGAHGAGTNYKPGSYPSEGNRRRRYAGGGGSEQCVGEGHKTESCNPGPCAQWAPWSSWTPCSATCGPGVQSRTRTCVGGTCVGESKETKPCNECPCPAWTEWGPWGPCTTSCGYGTRARVRECPSECSPQKHQAHGAGKYGSSGSAGGACPGDSGQNEPCGNVYWAPWGDWAPCSASCGVGYQTRTRICNCGTDCEGDNTESTHCEYPCPTQPYYPPPQAYPQPQSYGTGPPLYGYSPPPQVYPLPSPAPYQPGRRKGA